MKYKTSKNKREKKFKNILGKLNAFYESNLWMRKIVFEKWLILLVSLLFYY